MDRLFEIAKTMTNLQVYNALLLIDEAIESDLVDEGWREEAVEMFNDLNLNEESEA